MRELAENIALVLWFGAWACLIYYGWIYEWPEEAAVPCETDNHLHEVHYGTDTNGMPICYVTRYNPVTGVPEVLVVEAMEDTDYD